MHLAVLTGDGDIAVRLVAAFFVGSLIGLNRDLHGKPAGLRTHAIVSLGAAVAAVVACGLPGQTQSADPNAISRVLQGILTGIGFLGAGVILRDVNGHVSGLTSAATIWLAATLGVAAGLGYWPVLVIAIVLTVLVLVLGGPIELFAERLFKRQGPRRTDRGV